MAMSFDQEIYFQEKFSKLALTKEVIPYRTFEECEFASCSFVDCRFEKCKFLNCKFTDCILSAVIPMDCRISDLKFLRCKVIGMDWTKTQKVEGLDFSECQLNYSNFKLVKLPKMRMVRCEAREVEFIEADLSEGDFKNTDFEKSRFFKTNLTGADFKDARNYSIDVKNNIIKKARFSLPEAMSLLDGLEIKLE
jgi:fluoroquinolone resistance protein